MISRMSSARSWVCCGGSIVTMCSFIGSWSRWRSMIVADVVANEWYRERDERTDHRVARRERVGVVVDLWPPRSRSPPPRRDAAVAARGTPSAAARSRDTGSRRATRHRSSRVSSNRPSPSRSPPVLLRVLICTCPNRCARLPNTGDGAWQCGGRWTRRGGSAHRTRRRAKLLGCGREAHVGGRATGRHVTTGRAEGRHQLAAGPLLLSDDRTTSSSTCSGRRAEEGFGRFVRSIDAQLLTPHDLELADRRLRAAAFNLRVRCASPTTGRRYAPRSRATPNVFGPCNPEAISPRSCGAER